MKNIQIKFSILGLLLLFVSNIYAQVVENKSNNHSKSTIVDAYLGMQWSGIRKEDFIRSNFSPYVQIGVGKEISPIFTLMLNYQGTYFYYIADSFTHKYSYLGGDVVVSLNQLANVLPNSKLKLHAVAGVGYFYNSFKQKSSICLNAAIIGEYEICENYSLKAKAGGIGGWKIYQHDKDALPNVSFGISRRF